MAPRRWKLRIYYGRAEVFMQYKQVLTVADSQVPSLLEAICIMGSYLSHGHGRRDLCELPTGKRHLFFLMASNGNLVEPRVVC